MSQLHFAITGDNSNIMAVINDTTRRMEEFGKLMSQIGKSGVNFNSLEDKLNALRDAIKSNEEVIESYKEQIKEMTAEMNKAALAGDTTKVEQYKQQIKGLGQEMVLVENETKVLRGGMDSLGESMNGAEKSAQGADSSMGGLTRSIMRILPLLGVDSKEMRVLSSIMLAYNNTTKKATTATSALSSVIKKSPLAVLLTALTAVVAITGLFKDKNEELIQSLANAAKGMQDEENQLRSLINTIKDETKSQKEREDAIKKVNSTYGQHLQNLIDEKTSVEGLEAAYNNLTIAIQKNYIQKIKEASLGEVQSEYTKEYGKIISASKSLMEKYGVDDREIGKFVGDLVHELETTTKKVDSVEGLYGLIQASFNKTVGGNPNVVLTGREFIDELTNDYNVLKKNQVKALSEAKNAYDEAKTSFALFEQGFNSQLDSYVEDAEYTVQTLGDILEEIKAKKAEISALEHKIATKGAENGDKRDEYYGGTERFADDQKIKKAREELKELETKYTLYTGKTLAQAVKYDSSMEEYARKRANWLMQLARDEVAMEQERAQMVVDAMERGNLKESEALEVQFDKRREAEAQELENRRKEIIEMRRAEYKQTHGGSEAGFDEMSFANDEAWLAALNVALEKSIITEEQYNAARERLEKSQEESRQRNRWHYLQAYGSYKEQELAITEEYDDKIAKTDDEYLKKMYGAEKERKLWELAMKQKGVYSLIFADFKNLSKSQIELAKKAIEDEIAQGGDFLKLNELYKRLENANYTITSMSGWGFSRYANANKLLKGAETKRTNAKLADSAEERNRLNEEAMHDEQQALEELTQGTEELVGMFDSLGQALQSFGGVLAGVGQALSYVSTIAGGIGGIKTSIVKKDTAGVVSGVAGLAFNALSVVGGVISKNKKLQEEWNNTVAKCAQQYKLLKIEALDYKQRNLFGVENPYERAYAGAKQYALAIRELRSLTGDLAGGKVKTGTHYKWFQKKYKYSTLAKRYGDLYDKDTYELNPKILADYDKLDKATKQLVDNWEAIRKKMEEADKAIEDVASSLSGGLSTGLKDILVEAFKNDQLYQSIDSFKFKVEDTLDEIVSQIAFNEAFGDLFDELDERMKKSLSSGKGITDDIVWFYENYSERLGTFQSAMETARQEAEARGYNLFDNRNYEERSTTGSYQGMTQEMGAALEGRATAIHIALNTLVEKAMNSIALFERIADYTEGNNSELTEIKNLVLRGTGYLEDIASRSKYLAHLVAMASDLETIKNKL